MNIIKFKQFYVQKNFKERFLKPMVSWSEFFRVGLYDSEKFKSFEGTIEYTQSIMNNHKIIFYSIDEFEVKTLKSLFIDKNSTVSKINSDEINPRKAHQYSVILRSQEGVINIPTATNADAELVLTFLQDKIKELQNKEKNHGSILKSKLNEIKTLFEEGIISKEEYESKRKQIIEKY